MTLLKNVIYTVKIMMWMSTHVHEPDLPWMLHRKREREREREKKGEGDFYGNEIDFVHRKEFAFCCIKKTHDTLKTLCNIIIF